MKKYCITLFISIFILSLYVQAQNERTVWSKEKASEWYATKGWLRGSNFITSSAINQLEMWQQQSFDSAAIDKYVFILCLKPS